jgi:hypothetical protein
MSAWDVIVPAIALVLGAVVASLVRWRRAAEPPVARAKIVFPFVGARLSERALEATLRLARAEDAVVVPAYLATVPLPLTLDAPLGRACDAAFAVFEAIEQRAAKVGVSVDGRIARGRNLRHALRTLMDDVPSAARIVVAAPSDGEHDGFSVDDIAWLLRHADAEVLVLRAARRARRGSAAHGGAAHRPAPGRTAARRPRTGTAPPSAGPPGRPDRRHGAGR